MHWVDSLHCQKSFQIFLNISSRKQGSHTRAHESLLQGQWDSLWSQEMAVATTMRIKIHFLAQVVAGNRNFTFLKDFLFNIRYLPI